MVASAGRWSLIRELRNTEEPTLAELIRKMEPVDLLLVEGFKREGHDKIEVFRHDHDQEFLAPGDENIIAVAGDGPIEGLLIPMIDLNDTAAIASFILTHIGLDKAPIP
jgi:molybdopterin-guanine dinucleotide biosynthesis protein MobB